MGNILIFGDSYSTFEGYIPNGYKTYYPHLDVQRVEQTWWSKYIQTINGKLIQNNSWSGSTIGYIGYEGDCSQTNSFIYRYRQLKAKNFFKENQIDTVLVFGGTNDSWANAALGEMLFSHWEEKDLFQVFPAVCYFTYCLKNDLPNAEIIFIINTDINPEIQTAIAEAAKYYGVKCIQLQDIDKVDGHPTAKGMEQICLQVLKEIH